MAEGSYSLKLPPKGRRLEALGDRPAFFSMGFAPTLEIVSVVRRFVESFYAELIDDPTLSGRIAVTSHELMENAVRYCSGEEATIRVSLGRLGDGFMSSIRTRNVAKKDDIERVRGLLERVTSAPEADALYQEMLIESAQRELGSGLGLARVRAEGEMKLEFETWDNTIEVVATCRLSSESLAEDSEP